MANSTAFQLLHKNKTNQNHQTSNKIHPTHPQKWKMKVNRLPVKRKKSVIFNKSGRKSMSGYSLIQNYDLQFV